MAGLRIWGTDTSWRLTAFGSVPSPVAGGKDFIGHTIQSCSGERRAALAGAFSN